MRYLPKMGFALALMSQACTTVTAYRGQLVGENVPPDFDEMQSFYFWGLTPSVRVVNTLKVCKGRDAKKYQTTASGWDMAARVLTFGIYFPQTARVWCVRRSR